MDKRINYFLIKNNVKLIPFYFKLKKSLRTKNEKLFLDCIKYVVENINVELRFSGLEILESLDSFVIFSNHQSLFDPLFLMYGVNANISFLAKDELSKIKLIRQIFEFNKSTFVDRNDVRSGLKAILELNDLAKNRIIGAFPEGTRTKDGFIGEFKDGCFKLGTKIDIPIVICSINGAYNLDNTKNKVIVNIDFLDVLYKNDYRNIKTKDLSILVKNKLIENTK